MLLIALWLLFVFKMRSGRIWARIGGIHVAFLAVTAIFADPAGCWGTLAIVQDVLVVAAIVLMFRPAAATYFRTAPPATPSVMAGPDATDPQVRRSRHGRRGLG